MTSLARNGGCGCKLPAADLLRLLGSLPPQDDPRLLIGAQTADDAAVFAIRDDLALVHTIDFFPPLVDDPFDFGRIAAANALSDIYAMGGTPLTALSVVAFPLGALGADVLAEILRGSAAVTREAGVVTAGGHSIEDAEPKYGLAVTGTVDPRRIVTNAGGRPGDALVLTKPLGTGAVVAARKRGAADDVLLARAVATMTELNADASQAALGAGVHAMTDITGFGLLGHLHHLCRESGLAAELDAGAVPALDGIQKLLEGHDDVVPGRSGGSERNAAWSAGFTRFQTTVPAWQRRLVTDATTSGGLLIALPPNGVAHLPGQVVGTLRPGVPGTIEVR